MEPSSRVVNTGRFVYKDPDLQFFEDTCKERIKGMALWAKNEMNQMLSAPGVDLQDRAKINELWKSCKEKASVQLDKVWFHNDPENEKYKQLVLGFISHACRDCIEQRVL